MQPIAARLGKHLAGRLCRARLRRAALAPGIVTLICSGAAALPSFAAAQEPASPVVVEPVEARVLPQEVPLPGSVVARRSSELSAELDGLVAEVLADDGDLVEAGEVLLRLRAKPTELALEAARAEVARAEARARLARLGEARNAELLESRMVPEESYDIAAAQLRESEAALAAAKARLALVQDELARHEVRAPFGGVIGRKRTEAGAWVRAGDVVFSLHELDVVRIRFALPQARFAQVDSGTRVTFTADALPGRSFEAAVTRKVRVGSAAARTFPVLVDIENRERRLAPGMSVDVVVTADAGASAQAVPTVSSDAIVLRPDGTELLWVVAGEPQALTARPVPVVTGRRYRDRVAIERVLDGALPEGSRVVVRGNENLRPGQPVRLVR